MKKIISSSFLILFMVSLTIAIVINQNDAKADWQPAKKCVEGDFCDGLAPTGTCQAQGMLCYDETHSCLPYNQGGFIMDPSGCTWRREADCVSDPTKKCELYQNQQYIGNQCGGGCRLTTYNNCTCFCTKLGSHTCETWTGDDCSDTCNN